MATGAPLVIDERVTRKVAVAALVGTALEWYDFFLFTTAAALVFNVQYFISDDPVRATIYSFGTLAVGFIARPIGALVCGTLGDKIGRRKILMVTVAGIGLVTGLIGMLPNYMSIGVAAPLMLIALRIVQGLAVGGEWSGAIVIAVEHAPAAKRARYAALPQIGSPIGTLLSSGGFFAMAYLLSKDDFDSFGWRIPFLAAIPLLLICLWIRSKLSESPEFQALIEAGETEHAPVRRTFVDSWRQIIVGMASTLLGVGGFYLVTTFVVYYGTGILGMSRELMLAATLVAAVVEIPVLLWGGRLGEKYGASKVILWGGIASALVAFPLFLAVQSEIPALVIIGTTVGVACLSLPYAVSGTALTGLFPVKTRYTGVAVASNIASVLSGFVPMAATALLAVSGNSIIPSAILLVAIAALTAVSGLLIPRLSIQTEGLKY